MRLRKSTFRYIEDEIYDYYKNQRYFEELTKDIILASFEPQEIKSTDISDPTFSTAYLLVSDKIRRRIQVNINAIDTAFNALDSLRKEVLEDKYWKRYYLTWSTIADIHRQDRRTIYRWRNDFVMEIANTLGLR